MTSRIITVFTLCLLASFSHAQKEGAVTHLDAAKVAKIANDEPNLVIIDIRTEGEFANGHLKSAVNIDYLSEDFADKLEKLDKDAPTLLHCASGARTKLAMEKVKPLGFNKLYVLNGGLGALLETSADIPLVSSPAKKDDGNAKATPKKAAEGETAKEGGEEADKPKKKGKREAKENANKQKPGKQKPKKQKRKAAKEKAAKEKAAEEAEGEMPANAEDAQAEGEMSEAEAAE